MSDDDGAAPPDKLLLAVRATVKLPGLHVGQEVWVDPDEPYIGDCLEAQYLVPVEP